MSSKFFTNDGERSLFDKFTGIIDAMGSLYAFYAVVGYFRSSGYFALQPYLKNVKEIKILVGINVDQMFAEAQRKGLLFFGDEARTKMEFLNWFLEDIREAKYTKEVEDGIQQFVNDTIDGRIRTASMPEMLFRSQMRGLLRFSNFSKVTTLRSTNQRRSMSRSRSIRKCWARCLRNSSRPVTHLVATTLRAPL